LNRLWLGPLYKAAFILAAGKPCRKREEESDAAERPRPGQGNSMEFLIV